MTDMYATEDEIRYLQSGARLLRASANKSLYFAFEQARPHEQTAALRLAADNLRAADKLDGYANHLSMFGRDYYGEDYADESDPA